MKKENIFDLQLFTGEPETLSTNKTAENVSITADTIAANVWIESDTAITDSSYTMEGGDAVPETGAWFYATLNDSTNNYEVAYQNVAYDTTVDAPTNASKTTEYVYIYDSDGDGTFDGVVASGNTDTLATGTTLYYASLKSGNTLYDKDDYKAMESTAAFDSTNHSTQEGAAKIAGSDYYILIKSDSSETISSADYSSGDYYFVTLKSHATEDLTAGHFAVVTQHVTTATSVTELADTGIALAEGELDKYVFISEDGNTISKTGEANLGTGFYYASLKAATNRTANTDSDAYTDDTTTWDFMNGATTTENNFAKVLDDDGTTVKYYMIDVVTTTNYTWTHSSDGSHNGNSSTSVHNIVASSDLTAAAATTSNLATDNDWTTQTQVTTSYYYVNLKSGQTLYDANDYEAISVNVATTTTVADIPTAATTFDAYVLYDASDATISSSAVQAGQESNYSYASGTTTYYHITEKVAATSEVKTEYATTPVTQYMFVDEEDNVADPDSAGPIYYAKLKDGSTTEYEAITAEKFQWANGRNAPEDAVDGKLIQVSNGNAVALVATATAMSDNSGNYEYYYAKLKEEGGTASSLSDVEFYSGKVAKGNDWAIPDSVTAARENKSNNSYTVVYQNIGAATSNTLVSNLTSGTSVIDANARNDTIYVGKYVKGLSIQGGKGNDTFKLDETEGRAGNIFIYNKGDGKDTIEGWSDSDTLLVSVSDDMRVSMAANSKDGNDLVLSFMDADELAYGSVTFKNVETGTTINVLNATNTTTRLISLKDITGVTADSETAYTMQNIMQGTNSSESIKNEQDGTVAPKSGVDSETGVWSMLGGIGNDTISNQGSFVYIDGGEEKDRIIIKPVGGTATDSDSLTQGVTIVGGTGEDIIDVSGDVFTATGGVKHYGAHQYIYTIGDGNDTIIGYNSSDTLLIKDNTGVEDLASSNGITGAVDKDGNYVITITGDSGTTSTIVLKESAADTELHIFHNNIPNNPANYYSNEINIGTNDTINNKHLLPREIVRTQGNDNINLATGDASVFAKYTVNAGAGNDLITVNSAAMVINGEDGNDKITLTGGTNVEEGLLGYAAVEADAVTVNGGYGNDYIDARQDTILAADGTTTVKATHVYKFGANDGNDTIYGFNESDTIVIDISGGTPAITAGFDKNGTNYVISVGASAQLTLMDVTGGTRLNIKDTSGNVITGLSNVGTAVDSDTDGNTDYYIIPNVLQGTSSADGLTGSGTARKIKLTNTNDNFEINALAGNDTIENRGASNVLVKGGEGHDRIYLTRETLTAASGSTPATYKYGSGVTVYGGAGNDIIVGEYVDSANDSDTFSANLSETTNYSNAYTNDAAMADAAAKVHTFQFGYADGNDTIYFFGEDDLIYLDESSTYLGSSVNGSGDLIVNIGYSDTDKTVTSKMILVDYGEDLDRYVSISAVDHSNGVRSTQLYALPKELKGTTGSDAALNNNDDEYKISALAGNDVVNNNGSYVTVDAGDGNDTIYSRGESNSIFGGKGNDVVILQSDTVTISGTEYNGADYTIVEVGKGNDTIVGTGEGNNIYRFGNADGTNYILNFVSGDVIQLDKTTSGEAVTGEMTTDGYTLTVGSTKIILKGSPKSGMAANEWTDAAIPNPKNYNNLESNIKVRTRKYDTTAERYVSSDTFTVPALILGTSGNDIGANAIHNEVEYTGFDSSDKYTIDAGAGHDRIYNEGKKVSIEAGLGNDTVSLGAEAGDNTVHGGNGDDIIYGNGIGNLYKYALGDGNDTIVGYTSSDKLEITGVADYSTDTTITGRITDKGYVLTIGTNTILLKGLLKEFNYATASDSYVATLTEDQKTAFTEETDSDKKSASVKAYYETKFENYDFLEVETAINIYDSDNTKQNTIVIPKVINGTQSDNVLDISENFDGYTINALNGKDTINNESNQVTINAGGDNDVINLIKGSEVEVNVGKGNDIIIVDSDTSDGHLFTFATGDGENTIRGLNSNDTINITSGSIKSSAFDDDGYFVITLEDNTQIKLISNTPTETSVVNAGYKSLTYENSYYLKVGEAEAEEKTIPRVVDISKDGTDTNQDSTKDSVTLDSAKSNYDVIGNDADNTITNDGANNVSISGGAGNDNIIINSGEENTINGGANSDYIKLVSTGHTVEYAKGDGNDTIEGWNANDDLLVLSGITNTDNIIAKVTKSGLELVIGSGKIVFKDAHAGDVIKIQGDNVNRFHNTSGIIHSADVVDAEDNIYSITVPKILQGTTDADKGTDSNIWDTDTGTALVNDENYNNGENDGFTIDGGNGNDAIKNIGNNVSISGGAGNDTIFNDGGDSVTILGGSGADSIVVNGNSNFINANTDNDIVSLGADSERNTVIGAKGNDTIYFNDLNNTFRYNAGDGNDLILGFNAAANTIEMSEVALATLSDGTPITEVTSDGFVIYINQDANNDGQSDTLIIKGAKLSTATGDTSADFDGLSGGTKINFVLWSGTSSSTKVATVPTQKIVVQGTTLVNYDPSHTITGSTVKDTIVNAGDAVTINADNSKDIIVNSGDNVSINAGDGDDIIILNNVYTAKTGSESKVTEIFDYTDANGDSMVIPEAEKVTIKAGLGDDTIFGNTNADDNAAMAHVYQYTKGDGKDIIYGFGENDIIDLGTFTADDALDDDTGHPFSWSILNIEDSTDVDDPNYKDVLIGVGSGSITLKHLAVNQKVNIQYTGSDTVVHSGTSVIQQTVYKYHEITGIEASDATNWFINQTDGYTVFDKENKADYIQNEAEDVTIDLTYNNNYVKNTNKGANATINTGSGDDTIENDGSGVVISAGTGKNTITNSKNAAATEITAGGGDDTINNSATAVTINAGAGKNVINNYKDAEGTQINTGDGRDVIYNDASEVEINTGNNNDVIFVDSDTTNEKTSAVTVNAGKGDDLILGSNTGGRTYIYNSGDGHDVIDKWSGDDILEFNLGVSETYTHELTTNGLVFTISSTVTITEVVSGTTVTTTETQVTGSITITNISNFDMDTDVNVSYTMGELEGGKQINISGTVNGAAFDGENYETEKWHFVKDTIDNKDDEYYIKSASETDKVIINTGANVTINAGDGKDTIYNDAANTYILGGASNDIIFIGNTTTTVEDVLTGGTNTDVAGITIDAGLGDDLITAKEKHTNGIVYEYHEGDGSDTIVGFSANDTIKVYVNAGSSYKNTVTDTVDADNNFILNIGEGRIFLDGFSTGTVHVLNANDPEADLQAIDVPVIVNPDADGKITNSTAKAILVGNDEANTISNDADNVAIRAAGGNDEITVANNKNVTITAGGGADTIEAAKSHSNGILFQFSGTDGENLIKNFNSYDTISYSGSYSDISSIVAQNSDPEKAATVSDLVLTFGSTKVTLDSYGGKGSKVAILASDLEEPEILTVNYVMPGTSAAETFDITEDDVQVLAQGGNDTVTNAEYRNALIYGGAGNDSIVNGGQYVTIHADDVNSTVANNNNDIVENTGSDVKIYTYAGADSINNSGTRVTIEAGADADTIDNSGGSVTIDAGAGADRVINTADNVSINLGADTDSINNEGSTVTILGGAGNDTILNSGTTVFIDVDAGTDKVTNTGRGAIINLGAGNDTIWNTGSDTSIFGGLGNDSIILNEGSFGTVYAGAGNDTIRNNTESGTHVYQFSSTDGMSTRIEGFSFSDTIQLMSFTGTTAEQLAAATDVMLIPTASNFINDFSQLVFSIGNGSVTVNADDIIGNAGSDIKIANASGTMITGIKVPNLKIGTANPDTQTNVLSDYNIFGLGGRDYISNSGTSVTIDAGAGTDYVFNSGTSVSIFGGTDADTIHTSSTGIGNVTIYGGRGNDSIKNTGSTPVIYQFGTGENVNTIEGFNKDDDMLYFSSIANSNTSISAASINADGDRISLVAANTTIFANSDDEGAFNEGIKFIYRGHESDDPSTITPYVRVIEANGAAFTGTESDPVTRIYGQGTNKISAQTASTSIYASSGNNTISATGDSATVMTSSGDDVITIGGSGGTVNSGQGDDTIVLTGNATNNTIYAGKGADVITSNGKGNIFYYAGNIAESSISSGQSTDTIKNFDVTKDHILVRSTGTSVTSAVSGSDINLTLQSGSYLTYIKLEGKSSATQLKFYLGTATAANERTQNVNTTSQGNNNWAAIGASSRVAEEGISAINDLFEDDNYMTNDSQISSITNITADNYSAGNIESLDINNLTKNNYIPTATFTSKKE